jgi:hypothetical protein
MMKADCPNTSTGIHDLVKVPDFVQSKTHPVTGVVSTDRIRQMKCIHCSAIFQNTVDMDAAIHRQSHAAGLYGLHLNDEG